MNRRQCLESVRPQIERQVWTMLNAIRDTLVGLSAVPHFDLADDTAVASAIHSAIPSALDVQAGDENPLIFRHCSKGPGNKIVARVLIDGAQTELCLEMHLAGPKGGTRKQDHQFAGIADPEQGELWEDVVQLEVPEAMLCFVAYRLNEARTQVQDAWLVFADGKGREKIRLRQIESDASAGEDSVPKSNQVEPVGATIKVNPSAKGPSHDQHKNKREEDPSGA